MHRVTLNFSFLFTYIVPLYGLTKRLDIIEKLYSSYTFLAWQYGLMWNCSGNFQEKKALLITQEGTPPKLLMILKNNIFVPKRSGIPS